MYKIEPDIYEADVESKKAALALESAKFEKAQKDWERARGLYEAKAINEQDKDKHVFCIFKCRGKCKSCKQYCSSTIKSMLKRGCRFHRQRCR